MTGTRAESATCWPETWPTTVVPFSRFFLVGSFWLDHVPVASCWASGWDRIWAANCVKFHSSARMIPWNASRKIKF